MSAHHKLTCVAISDTHNKHGEIDLPIVDVLIHAGDALYVGDYEEFEKFSEWLTQQPHKHKLYVPGNHDRYCEKELVKVSDYFREAGVHFLIDRGVRIDGVLFYGTPAVTGLPAWSFNYADKSEGIEEKLARIPYETDVLITHGPAYGKLDKVPFRGWGNSVNYSVGSVSLLEAVSARPSIKYHVNGHIHESYGMLDGYGAQTTINAAICDRYYIASNKPICFDILLQKSEDESDIDD